MVDEESMRRGGTLLRDGEEDEGLPLHIEVDVRVPLRGKDARIFQSIVQEQEKAMGASSEQTLEMIFKLGMEAAHGMPNRSRRIRTAGPSFAHEGSSVCN